MSTSFKRRQARDESLDRKPLAAEARKQFEAALTDRPGIKGRALHLIEVLLGKFHWGKADSFVSNARLAKILKCTSRTIRNLLNGLRDEGSIILVEDRSITSQRRIVLANHPNAQGVLAELLKSPHVHVMESRAPREEKTSAPRGVKSPSPNGAPRGENIGAPRGENSGTCRGEAAVSPESLTVRSLNEKPEAPPPPPQAAPSSSSSSNSRGGPDDDDDVRSALLEPEEKTPEKTATLGTMDDVLDVMRRCTRIPKSLLDAIPGKTDLGYRIKGDWCTLALAAMRLDEKIRDKDAPPAGKIERPLAYLLGVFNEIKAPDFPPGERDDLAGKVERLRERAQEQTPTKGDFDESSYRVVVQGWIARAVETNVPAREIGPRIMGHIDKLADANPMAGTWEFQARERIATEEITAFLVGRGAS